MKKIIIKLIIIIIGVVAIFFIFIFSPIFKSNNVVVVIDKSQSVSVIGKKLHDSGVIPSSAVFKYYMRFSGNDRRIVPGDYYFYGNFSLHDIGKRLTEADYRILQKKIIIPEGSSVADIGNIITKVYPDFDNLSFVQEAYPYEGYLFPDTYDLSTGTTTIEVIDRLRNNFNLKTQTLHEQSDSLGKNWSEIIVMASILEEEGKTEEDRKIIAGILYNRLKAGIGLQVDSTFRAINGKTTKNLTLEDLKIVSPFNTYVYKGLPPSPITNPGLESIDAAIYPEETKYLYFLTGNDGKMYYAETFEQHVENKRKFLN